MSDTRVSPAGRHPADHDHAVELEHTLDFLNTLRYDDGIASDTIGDIDSALAFLRDIGAGHDDALLAAAGSDGEGWLARLRTVRAALREVYDAAVEGRVSDPGAIAIVNDALRARPQPELRSGPSGLHVGHRHPSDATGEVLARLAEPFLRAIADETRDRLRICANDRCRWVFRDTSRGGRRRWCDTAEANRAKVARFRSRRRSATGGPTSPAGFGGGVEPEPPGT
jgi:predicted RNA-binding Zn ribbon-like protein